MIDIKNISKIFNSNYCLLNSNLYFLFRIESTGISSFRKKYEQKIWNENVLNMKNLKD